LTGAQGALFWIGGAAGAGKTHFLNYVSALSSRAAPSVPKLRDILRYRLKSPMA